MRDRTPVTDPTMHLDAAGPAAAPPDHRARRARAARLAVLATAMLAAGCTLSPLADTPPSTQEPAVAVSTDLRGYRLDLRAGERVEIRLPSNRSTGYVWLLVDPVPAMVRQLDAARYETGRIELAGAPGTEVWTFEAAARGTGQLMFEYRRPFDPPTVPPAQRTGYRVEVR